jgi:predicted aldo/keto reductase-like oxidoreductase
MRYSSLGKTGMRVSVLACGTNMLGSLVQDQANAILNYALDKGINFIVTSAAYRVVETMIAEAVGHRRDEFYLATTTDHRSAKWAKADIENSLKIFKTDFIDVYQIGGITLQRALDLALDPRGAVEALEEAKREGKIGAIGITGHNPLVLAKAISTGRFDTVLFFLNMAIPYAIEELIPLAKEGGIGTMVMQPLAHGFLKPVDKALRFVFCSGVDTVVSGMYWKSTVDENIAIAEPEPTESEWKGFLKELRELPSTGCRNCGAGCRCPHGISVATIMYLFNWRNKYGLLPPGEAAYRGAVERAVLCDGCGECERTCPYKLSIIPTIKRAVQSIDWLPAYRPLLKKTDYEHEQ